VIDAHSLYLQTLSDLGLVGGLLLFAALGVIVAALARHARDRHSALYAGLFAAALAWAVHAAVDWDWEMPVTTAWLFAAGGLALSKGDAALGRAVGLWPRLAAVVLLLAACVPSVRFAFSEPHLQRAARAFDAADCARARAEAQAGLRVLPARPEPLQIVGYCAMQQGRPAEAVAAMRQAVAREPRNWAFRYGLALAQASGGANPRPALAAARRLNPRDPLVAQGVAAFNRAAPSARRATAASLRAAALDSGKINLQ